jgi:hypothetical protein
MDRVLGRSAKLRNRYSHFRKLKPVENPYPLENITAIIPNQEPDNVS